MQQFIENLDCPHNTGEQPLDYDTPCYECTAPYCEKKSLWSSDNKSEPLPDIKYTLCGYGAQLEYLNYNEATSDISTSTSAEELKQYEEVLR